MDRRSFVKGLLSSFVLPKIKLPEFVASKFVKRTPTEEKLFRSQLWSDQIKQLLLDELETMRFNHVSSDIGNADDEGAVRK